MEILRRRNFHTAHGLGNLRWEHRKDFLIKYFYFFFAFLVHFEEWNLKRLKKSKTEIGVKATNHSGEKECRKEKLKITAQECEKISVVFRLDRGSMFVFFYGCISLKRERKTFSSTLSRFMSRQSKSEAKASFMKNSSRIRCRNGLRRARSESFNRCQPYKESLPWIDLIGFRRLSQRGSWHSLNDLNLDCIIRCKFTTKLLETVEVGGWTSPAAPELLFLNFPFISPIIALMRIFHSRGDFRRVEFMLKLIRPDERQTT